MHVTLLSGHTLKMFCLSEKRCRHFFYPSSIHLSSVILAKATVVPFVQLRNSRFNFHCYTQCEATPTQKSSARKQYSVKKKKKKFLHEDIPVAKLNLYTYYIVKNAKSKTEQKAKKDFFIEKPSYKKKKE